MNDSDEFAWADSALGEADHVEEIYCLTFIKDIDVTDALRRLGALPDTFATRSPSDIADLDNFADGYPDVAAAVQLDGWTVVFEPGGFEGSLMTAALSKETETITVLRHDYSEPGFEHAVDGELVTGFDPRFPTGRYGSDPDRLVPLMRDLGFELEDDEEGQFDGAFARSLRLARRLAGTAPTYKTLIGPLPSAYIERWFSAAPKKPAVRRGHDGPVDAVAEVRRLAALHGLSDTPGLDQALAAAEDLRPVVVSPDSELGQHVRRWLTEAKRAHRSLNDTWARSRMTEAQRMRAFELGGLVGALGAALQNDPVTRR